MSENRTQDWVKLLTTPLIGLVGSLIGGGVMWGIATTRINEIERRTNVNENDISKIQEQQTLDRVYLAGELGQIKAKLDALQK